MKDSMLPGFLIGLLIAFLVLSVTLRTTNNRTNTWIFWYPDSGFVILQKDPGKKFGKWRYKIQDAYNSNDVDLYIRSNQNWQVGDTILLMSFKK